MIDLFRNQVNTRGVVYNAVPRTSGVLRTTLILDIETEGSVSI